MHLSCDFFSEALQVCASFELLVPQPKWGGVSGSTGAERPAYPVLYLLHGLSDDHTIWHRRTAIERMVDSVGLVVVMPAVNRSYYADQANGYRYFSYVADELPQLVKKILPVSSARADTFVAGNSMGGYGAYKLALTYPERYAAAVSFSGLLDLNRLATFITTGSQFSKQEMERSWGDLNKVPGGPNDLLALLENNVRKGAALPSLHACCGKDDFLLDHNHAFVEAAKRLGVPLDYIENDGAHNWDYWDKMLPWALKQMGFPRK